MGETFKNENKEQEREREQGTRTKNENENENKEQGILGTKEQGKRRATKRPWNIGVPIANSLLRIAN
jgi:hypothetical protein